jgi:hypothetical protein
VNGEDDGVGFTGRRARPPDTELAAPYSNVAEGVEWIAERGRSGDPGGLA